MRIFSILLGAVLIAGAAVRMGLDRNAEDSAYDALAERRPGGLRQIEKALGNDPASPYRWCELADALLISGDAARARYCFERASELGGNLPPILMRVSNFYFGIEQPRRAVVLTERLLRLTAAYDDPVFQAYDWAKLPPAELLARGVPANMRAGQAWFRHLLEGGRKPETAATWEWLGRNKLRDDALAASYVDFLVANHAYAEAAVAWSGYLGARAGEYPKPNGVFNGGFELAPTGAMLDWRIERVTGVESSFDRDVHHQGTASLKLHFEGVDNPDYHHAAQTVLVTPGRYRFQGFMRTREITTDQGIRFRIFDPDTPARLDVMTDQHTGSGDWTKIERIIVIRPGTNLVRIAIERRPSMKFDNKIGGVGWIDSVSLVRID